MTVARSTLSSGARRTTQALGAPWPANRPLWVFGYGSLIYRVDFPVEAQRIGYIKGHRRAFLQKSHDHRGTPEHPGRVCTLIEHSSWADLFPNDDDKDTAAKTTAEEEVCWGVAYRIKSGMEQQVKRHLDHREKDGYSVAFLDVFGRESDRRPVLQDVVVYVGETHNPSFAGASSLEDTARVVAHAQGPSGSNREYLFRLCDALRQLGPDALDPYLAHLETLVKGHRPAAINSIL
ncbi:Cation transport regulator-like protein 2 [Coemansia interrupta]|uniref:glutathione-specific gamma-glutamylcyclotransferase n=1 Tax=Coemansia interrupta TaxID=1126814 RepID=A0A9W8HHP2_9FUNG|nr:Cation transport regulator-like protein 2 [Coemansia interrupta]